MTRCALCGTPAPGGEAPLTWGLSFERDRTARYCEPCTRDHLRTIEGRLDLTAS